MKLSEIEWQDVELVPQVVRANKQDNISGIISVSRKAFVFDAVKLSRTAKTKPDPEITLLLDKNVFSYIKLPVNIRPGEFDVRFLSVDVVLESEHQSAVCWSMEPSRVEHEIKLKTDSVLSGGLKLQAVEVGASDSLSEEFTFYQPSIEAFGIGTENPGWEFSPTKGRRLSGIYILHMVVLIPKNTQATGRVIIKADIFRDGWLWNYRTRSKENSEEVLSIGLPGFSY